MARVGSLLKGRYKQERLSLHTRAGIPNSPFLPNLPLWELCFKSTDLEQVGYSCLCPPWEKCLPTGQLFPPPSPADSVIFLQESPSDLKFLVFLKAHLH